jgi:hypothetical protein
LGCSPADPALNLDLRSSKRSSSVSVPSLGAWTVLGMPYCSAVAPDPR